MCQNELKLKISYENMTHEMNHTKGKNKKKVHWKTYLTSQIMPIYQYGSTGVNCFHFGFFFFIYYDFGFIFLMRSSKFCL